MRGITAAAPTPASDDSSLGDGESLRAQRAITQGNRGPPVPDLHLPGTRSLESPLWPRRCSLEGAAAKVQPRRCSREGAAAKVQPRRCCREGAASTAL